MSKPALLFLAHRIPYPPNKGDKIRSFNLLKSLARDYRIFLAAFVDDRNDWQYEAELHNYCTELLLLGIENKHKYRTLTAFFTNEALSLPYYRQVRLQSWVDEKIQHENISRVFVYSSAMAQYVREDKYRELHRIIDFVDVDSEKWREYSRRRGFPMNWLYRREAVKLLEYDRCLAREFDASLFVSEHEAELFKTLAPESQQRITFINNGVDSHYFSPEHEFSSPYGADEKVLVFTGAMDYWANIDAVSWFAQEVFPQIVREVPQARFYIVGARPGDKVKKLAAKPQIHVTGAVKDIRPYIAHAAVAVTPMRIARGIQNKVLEAMAMAKPVVATPAAMEGIDAAPGQPVCESARAFSQACVELLAREDNSELGQRERQQILDAFNWDRNLMKLEILLGDREADKATEPYPAKGFSSGNATEAIVE